MAERTLHLLCNAHLDPVWLWEWEEGAAEALSTFRCAADFCDEFPGFIFNHNEAVLYQWVEEHEPALFKRIQKLVKQGRWKILGGWYLQPDCNMPSGESMVRQVLIGKAYFREKFGVDVTTAMNVDPFGHSRGLAQILARSGHKAYLFCRPGTADLPLPGDDFLWVGYDGSTVIGHRTNNWYNSGLGTAAAKVGNWMKDHDKDSRGIVLWGVGNHGGGPSRQDLKALAKLIGETSAWDIKHASADHYFAQVEKIRATLPRVERDLNLWAPGCYTSQVRIKQGHRRLENELYAVEAMGVHASAAGFIDYPADEIARAQRDLLFCEFHDILPGSSIQPVEDMALRQLGHGLEELSRAKARCFFALAAGQRKAKDGEIPVLVYNPHPWPVRATVEVEFQLQDQNWSDTYTDVSVHAGNTALPTQVEKELSNLTLDWRKRVIFQTTLQPATMNRFDCRLKRIPAKPAPQFAMSKGAVRFRTKDLDVEIGETNGLLNAWKVDGRVVLRDGGKALVLRDDEDPWGMMVQKFRDVEGSFALLSPADAAIFAGIKADTLAPVRIIEDGPVRTVVECLFGYRSSRLVVRWLLPKQGSEIGLELRVLWNEKDRFLKLSLPTALTKPGLRGQVPYGSDALANNGNECVAQQWVAVHDDRHALTVINEGSYGCDCGDGELRLSLLRSAAYSSHPIGERPRVPQDRSSPRIDQGERLFRFWLNVGAVDERLAAADREALAHNRRPMALSFFPSGNGTTPKPLAKLSGDTVLLTACKRAEDGKGVILRLFNPTAKRQATTVNLAVHGISHRATLAPWQILSLRVDPKRKTVREVDLLERQV